jgi:hypothetical protein
MDERPDSKPEKRIENLDLNRETLQDLTGTADDLKAEEQEQVKGGAIARPNGTTQCTNGYCGCKP